MDSEVRQHNPTQRSLHDMFHVIGKVNEVLEPDSRPIVTRLPTRKAAPGQPRSAPHMGAVAPADKRL